MVTTHKFSMPGTKTNRYFISTLRRRVNGVVFPIGDGTVRVPRLHSSLFYGVEDLYLLETFKTKRQGCITS